MTALLSGNGAAQPAGAAPTAGRQDAMIENRQMTPETLWAFGRLGSFAVAPDGKRIVYTTTHYDIPENSGFSDLYIMDADGANVKRLTATAARESAPAWLPSGREVAFLRDGILWNIDPDSGTERQVSHLREPVLGFLYAPAGDKILLVVAVKVEGYSAADRYPDLDKANALRYDDLMYRHWDAWKDGVYSHFHVSSLTSGGLVTEAEDIMPGEPYDAPMKPFGGTDDAAWHPDGKTVVYACKKLSGTDFAFRTDANLYEYDTVSKRTRLLTPDSPGYDHHPLFSPDGSQLLWLSMRRAGFEADRERILVADRATGAVKDVSEALDASPGSLQWTGDGRALYFTAPHEEAHQIYRLDLRDGNMRRITDGLHDYQNVQIAGDALIAARTTFVDPAEIFSVRPADGSTRQLSFINGDLLENIDRPTFEKRFVTTTDNRRMVTWVIYPPAFDRTKKYPALLICTGGPQGVLGPSFSYRWNYMLMAAAGYVVVVPARRGTSGSGQEWCDAISKNHGTQEEQDLLSAIDAVAAEPWIDADRIGAAGASFGGYSVFRLAGVHGGRFKAFLAHCGIFNMEFMYATTEEMFFEEWETGGAPWDADNAVAQSSFARSPHLLVKQWDTPIMVVHGQKDFRVPYSQGMAAFNTARMLGVESRLLIFPAENHWVLSPQNAIVWQREFFAWFDHYLKQ